MESGNSSATAIESSDSKTHPVASPGETSHVSPSKKPRSRAHSSCSSSSDEAIQLGNSAGTSTSNAGISTEEEIPVSSMPKSGGQCSDDPTQAREQPVADVSPSHTSSRIPSYVFATNKSSGNMEWSVASNESLFSIHTGNMSFTRDQLNWMSKSGELGFPLDPTFSGPLIDLPSSLMMTPSRLSTDDEIAKKSGNLKEEYDATVTEAAAAETMREVLMEKESQGKDNVAKGSRHSPSLSQHSDTSVKSFAFPILTGDSQRSCSFRPSNTKNKKLLSRTSTPKTTPQTPPETPKPQTTVSQTTPKETRNAGPGRWFSCFPCCPSCSRETPG